MAETCVKHSFEIAKDECRQCHNSYCEECLVYSFGPKKPPYCVTSALNAAGVRRTGARPNPRFRKKGFFGRGVMTEPEPTREVSLDDVRIELPDTLLGRPTATKTTRREVSPDLVEAVALNDSAAHSRAAGPLEHGAAFDETEGVDETEASLADWAASLGESDPGLDGRATGKDAWPEEPTIAPWPEADGGASGTSF